MTRVSVLPMALLITALSLLLAACAPAGDAASVVETYLQAKAAGDRAGVQANLCAAMEADLDREALSFANVETRINEIACEVFSTEGETGTVACSGAIIANYGGDDTLFPFSSYRVVQEDGVWKWCGEAG